MANMSKIIRKCEDCGTPIFGRTLHCRPCYQTRYRRKNRPEYLKNINKENERCHFCKRAIATGWIFAKPVCGSLICKKKAKEEFKKWE